MLASMPDPCACVCVCVSSLQERAPAPASPLGKQGSTGSRGSHAPIGPDSDDTQPQPQPSPQKRAHLPPGEPLSQQGPGSSGARGAGFRPRTSRWRRLTGTCATFLASGLAHEYIINMLLPPKADGSRPWLGKWTVFFAMQVRRGALHRACRIGCAGCSHCSRVQ